MEGTRVGTNDLSPSAPAPLIHTLGGQTGRPTFVDFILLAIGLDMRDILVVYEKVVIGLTNALSMHLSS